MTAATEWERFRHEVERMRDLAEADSRACSEAGKRKQADRYAIVARSFNTVVGMLRAKEATHAR